MNTIFIRHFVSLSHRQKKPELTRLPALCLLFSTFLLAAPASATLINEISNSPQDDVPSEQAGKDGLADADATPPDTITDAESQPSVLGEHPADEPVADKSPVDKAVTDNSPADESPVDESVTDNSSADKSLTETTPADNSEVETPTVSKTMTDEPDADASATVNSSTDVPGVSTQDPGNIAADINETTTETVSMPVAEDVDLSKPVIIPSEPPLPVATPTIELSNAEIALPTIEAEAQIPLVLLGEEVMPGTSARLSWSPDQHFDGISVPTPVLVVNGINPGKTLCLSAAIHGDELNGIEIVRRVMYDLDPEELNGAVVGVPIVNLQGFRRNSRYLPDRRDLNRFFPGNESGSSASRMAHSFFTQVISVCDALVDIHTGSFLRTNLPQLRADMTVPEVADLAQGFGATAVLHSSSAEGTLRRAAVLAGIPTVTLETGEPSRLQEEEIEHGTKGVQTLLTKLKMTRRVSIWGEPEPVYYKSVWVRADDGGLLFTSVKLGQRVREGQVLGTITDPITNVRTELISPKKGRVLGMALNQVVLPGFATIRIGIRSNEKEVASPTDTLPAPAAEQAAPDIPESVLTDVDIEDENS